MTWAHRVELALLIWFAVALVLGCFVGACFHFGMTGEPRDPPSDPDPSSVLRSPDSE